MTSAFAAPADVLIISPDADLSVPASIPRQRVLDDLQRLQSAAAAAYAGPDLSQVLQSIRATLPPGEVIDATLFCQKLAAGLANLRDGHLRASFLNQGCGSAVPIGHVGENLRAKAGTWGVATVNGQTVLSVPDFLSSDDPSWAGFLDQVRALKASGRAFILDLRGNRGGDNAMGVELARVLYDLRSDEPVPSPQEARLSLITPEVFALQANAWATEIIKARLDGQQPSEYSLVGRQHALDLMAKAETGEYPPSERDEIPQPDLKGRAIFKAPLYVLIDNRCASSCELTLEYLEALPQRVLVGESTMGAVEYGEIGKMLLPASRVLVTLATFSTRYRDYRTVEGVGYAPNIAVPAGGDALSVALKLIAARKHEYADKARPPVD